MERGVLTAGGHGEEAAPGAVLRERPRYMRFGLSLRVNQALEGTRVDGRLGVEGDLLLTAEAGEVVVPAGSGFARRVDAEALARVELRRSPLAHHEREIGR